MENMSARYDDSNFLNTSGGSGNSSSQEVTGNSGSLSSIKTVMLYGSEIVSLTINGCERLCLAQISNTLLGKYSYNEIHNRRVALGITCVQCTPVQLDQLRRAGAMPVSSRRCGMITKREADRLVKSFLDEINPPKLPLNFVFNVRHNCGWGCLGQFVPSRYNSSRAKCIKCQHCLTFFSPNKFIFHCHKPSTEDLKCSELAYHHPDAANFNAWRRHLVLSDVAPSEQVLHAWEDVKAMFNGGNRKRLLNQQHHSHDDHLGNVDSPVIIEESQPPQPIPHNNHSNKNISLFNDIVTNINNTLLNDSVYQNHRLPPLLPPYQIPSFLHQHNFPIPSPRANLPHWPFHQALESIHKILPLHPSFSHNSSSSSSSLMLQSSKKQDGDGNCDFKSYKYDIDSLIHE